MPLLAKSAAALVLALGLTGLPSMLLPSRISAGAVFANVIEQVKAARTVTYTMRIGDDTRPYKVSLMEPGLSRTVLPGGTIAIQDHLKGKSVVLSPDSKEILTIDLTGPAIMDPITSQIEHLRNFRGKPDADLGEKAIEGRTARGFRFSEGGYNDVVWVDVETKLPVRMENKTIMNAEPAKLIVMTDFVFDAPLDPALFTTTIPNGYKSQTLESPKITEAPVERDLIDLFGEYAKRSGGRFPNDLQIPSLQDVLKDIKLTKDGFDEDTNAWIAKIGKGLGLVWAMPPASEALYTGKGVKLGQADRPIFRYKPTDSKLFRVIYGDLTVKDVKPEQTAK